MKEANLRLSDTIYNNCIETAISCDELPTALELLHEMLQRNYRISDHTINALLSPIQKEALLTKKNADLNMSESLNDPKEKKQVEEEENEKVDASVDSFDRVQQQKQKHPQQSQRKNEMSL